jgi:uncharacterized membrane protein
LNDDDIRKITDAVGKAIDKKTSDFYVEREKHWKHHEFLDKLIDFFESAQKFTWRSLLLLFIFGILALVTLGFLFSLWIKMPGLFGGK